MQNEISSTQATQIRTTRLHSRWNIFYNAWSKGKAPYLVSYFHFDHKACRNRRGEQCSPVLVLSISLELSSIGEIVDIAIRSIPDHYPNLFVDRYVIMPNHIHMLLRKSSNHMHTGSVERSEMDGRAMPAPTGTMGEDVNISRVIQQLKGWTSKRCGISFWQKSYYDHIILDEQDYRARWKYIDENPIRWCEDEFHMESPYDLHTPLPTIKKALTK